MVPMGIRLPIRSVMSTSRAVFVGLLPMPLVKRNATGSATWRNWMNRSQITRHALPVSSSLRVVIKLKLVRRMPIQPTGETVGPEMHRVPDRKAQLGIG
jgi:hypothetical protein